jgi:hypothetical protein
MKAEIMDPRFITTRSTAIRSGALMAQTHYYPGARPEEENVQREKQKASQIDVA